jgi:AraC-like DNA-binding protein
LDATSTLFVAQHQEYADAHPASGIGHASLILRLNRSVLDELCGSGGASKHPAFDLGAASASPRLQLMTHALRDPSIDALHVDEMVLAAAADALGCEPRLDEPRSRRLADRAKEFLHAHGPDRLRLDEVATALNVSPVYLTNAFKRAEGVPLARYQTRLRLTHALARLPATEDITRLALELGFATHSHFTSVFRQNFGLSPSAYRQSRRRVFTQAEPSIDLAPG